MGNIVSCLFLTEVSSFLDLGVEVVRACLHNVVDLGAPEEKPIAWEDIGVLTEHLDFKLIDHKIQCHFRLIEGFQHN